MIYDSAGFIDDCLVPIFLFIVINGMIVVPLSSVGNIKYDTGPRIQDLNLNPRQKDFYLLQSKQPI